MADDFGRVPSGQALVQAPSPTVSALTGFDPSRIIALQGDRYSPNLRAWLVKHSKQRPWREFGVYREADGTLFVGYAEDDGYFIGTTLNSILIGGSKADIWAYGNLVTITPLPGFWEQYARIGRCAIDPEHRRPWQGEETRWLTDGDTRSCRWCGDHNQTLRRWTETVERERWEPALAAGAQRAETTQLAQAESRQSGAAEQRNAQGTQP